jgi:hypothetical protein
MCVPVLRFSIQPLSLFIRIVCPEVSFAVVQISDTSCIHSACMYLLPITICRDALSYIVGFIFLLSSHMGTAGVLLILAAASFHLYLSLCHSLHCSTNDFHPLFLALFPSDWGTRWRSWLRHCATSRQVGGSIPDGVIGIFSLT